LAEDTVVFDLANKPAGLGFSARPREPRSLTLLPPMAIHVIRVPRDMQTESDARRAAGQRLVVVPTMGSLHEGHLSLLRHARTRGDTVVMTLFVNPTQFAAGEDLSTYPRDEGKDIRLAEQVGADIVFAPSPADMYASDHETVVSLPVLSSPLCGKTRKEHFQGVATVVTKLFHITRPHVAVFGEKDYQQLALIRRLVRDLNFGITIDGCPIVRESDGLAMSSRNAHLTSEERAEAVLLHKALLAAELCYAAGTRASNEVLDAARRVLRGSTLAAVEYVELRCAASLEEVTAIEDPVVLAMAARFGNTRLIDNVLLG